MGREGAKAAGARASEAKKIRSTNRKNEEKLGGGSEEVWGGVLLLGAGAGAGGGEVRIRVGALEALY